MGNVNLQPPAENTAAILAALKGLHDVVDAEWARIDGDFEAAQASLAKASFLSSETEAPVPDIAARMNGLASDLESGKQGDVPSAKLLGSAVSTATASETARRNKQKLQNAVNVAVSKRVKQYFLSGGCTRDFSSTCPIGWTYANGLCSGGAGSPCKDLDLRN